MPVTASLIGLGGGALMGAMNSRAKQKQEQKNMKANATAIEMSPWTGMNAQMMPSTAQSTFGGALQGGLSGAMMGSQFGKGTEAAPTASAATDAAPTDNNAWASLSQQEPDPNKYQFPTFTGKPVR
jgi:hypothetical protein